MFVQLRSIDEKSPGDKWKSLFERTWPHYKKWFLTEGYVSRKGYLTSSMELEAAMPELYPFYEQLVELAGGGDLESRFLSMYCPPPYMAGCSQVALSPLPGLIRNYDYDPKKFEGVLIKTSWLKEIIGISDCTWGLLDGMNENGLIASLTFGGRQIIQEGFGIPLVIRYILETCTVVDEAIAVLGRIPVHMAYNVTVADKLGNYITAYLSPDREPIFKPTPVGTNHQEKVEWEDYARLTATTEREIFLHQLLKENLDGEHILKKFMKPPLYHTNYEKGFGTIYTIYYNPETMGVSLQWPSKSLEQSFDNFEEGSFVVHLQPPVSSKLSL